MEEAPKPKEAVEPSVKGKVTPPKELGELSAVEYVRTLEALKEAPETLQDMILSEDLESRLKSNLLRMILKGGHYVPSDRVAAFYLRKMQSPVLTELIRWDVSKIKEAKGTRTSMMKSFYNKYQLGTREVLQLTGYESMNLLINPGCSPQLSVSWPPYQAGVAGGRRHNKGRWRRWRAGTDPNRDRWPQARQCSSATGCSGHPGG